MRDYKILVVDDELDFLETLVNRLKKRDIDAEGALSGKEALELLETKEFDLVILDVKMPGMDGIEILKRIKVKWPEIEVIMLTGHASLELGIQGMEHGAYDYIMKPTKLEELIAKMDKAYERRLLRKSKKD